MKVKKLLGLALSVLFLVSGLFLTASAKKPASFDDYRLVKLENFPYDFCKSNRDGPNEAYFNIGVYAKNEDKKEIIQWGLMKKETLEVIYPCRYNIGRANADSAGSIDVLSTEGDGLVLLPCNGEGWIFGNLKGEEIPGVVYDDVEYTIYPSSRSEKLTAELIAVQKDGKWGAVDYQGRPVLACQYDSAPLFYEGIAQVYDQSLEQTVFIDREGNRLFKDAAHLSGCQLPWNDMNFYRGYCVVMDQDGRHGVINLNGELTVDFQYKYIEMLADGNLLVKEDYFPGQPNNVLRCGVITPEGKTLIPLAYQEIQDYGNQLFQVKQLKNPPANPKDDVPWDAPVNWYIYRIGEGIISPPSGDSYLVHIVENQYRYIQRKEDGNSYILDEEFDKLAGPYSYAFYTHVADEYDCRYHVSSSDGKMGLLDIKGNVLLPTEYDDLSWPIDGVMKASKNGKYGIIRDTGEVLVDFAYDDICCILLQPYGLKVFCVYESKENANDSWTKCWLIDENGRRLSGANGGLYGWGGSAYNECDYVISVAPYRGPNTKQAAVPAVRSMSLNRSAALPLADSLNDAEMWEYYGVERITDYLLEDSVTGVRVTARRDDIEEGSVLSAQVMTSGADYNKVKTELADLTENFSLFDLSLTKGDDAVHPKQEVQVSIPLPDEYRFQTTRVYAVDTDGHLTPLTAVEKEGCVVFSTKQMGKFVLASLKPTDTEDPNPSTGYDLFGMLAALSVLMMSFIFVCVLRKKRKSQ